MPLNEKFKYFPESWYPLCLSQEISPGEVKTLHVFAGSLVVFRSHEGKVGILKRYCPHMGTDLARASVHQNCLRCPFHHREYSTEGKCTKVPGATQIPQNAHHHSLPVHEAFGIVFMFLSETEKFPFPSFSRVENSPQYSSVITHTLRTPYQALLFNGFDTHHLTCIHNREITAPPVVEKKSTYHLVADFAMKVIPGRSYDFLVKWLNADSNDIRLDCWGGNFLIITNRGTEDNILITSVPIDYKNSRIFLSSMTEREEHFLKRQMQALRLKVTTYLGAEFLRPDIEIIEDMRPEIRRLHNEQDESVQRFWNYWDDLPRNRPLQESLTEN